MYMGAANLPDICNRLVVDGKPHDTPTAIIEWEDDRAATSLAALPAEAKKAGISHLADHVVRLRKTLQWFPEHQGGESVVYTES
ncbi:hypothetical protein [Geobacillus thermodenitrificans]|jgi:uroporphyrin-III C-methyltransferase|uniref:hypothetical protein n=1 Tax=Geobacillus thermodenitrificans TaxID=33940 RepID=UPI0004A39F13|nr:hypothetical protein [Geobacillus thermodenitrificans]ARA96640.1 hypothetical protein GD3902_00390 [Geobacillus thermodenitrificans]